MPETKLAEETALVQEPLIDKELARKKFLFKQISIPIATQSITFWEELTCVGYNPKARRIEGIVSLKQSSGYSGTVCNPSTKEYVRFFVDFKDGSGFHDMGFTSFNACDISDAPPGPQHPLMYMTQLTINDEKYQKLLDCNKAVIPTVRGILSWNSIPPSNPNFIPYYGNVKDVNVQLERKTIIIWKDIYDLLKVKPNIDLVNAIPPTEQIKLPPPPPPPVEDIYKAYKASGVPDKRTFFSTVAPLVNSKATFIKSTSYNINDVTKLKVDVEGLLENFINQKSNDADVTFEECRCIGLNTAVDTLGAVVHIKKPSGFSGNLCQKGSMEHVAFWADWDNNGTFEEYLGTVSLEVHDISNIPADGLYYNVALPINTAKHLKKCANPNVIGVRAVLSWEALPSTTDPNALNTWGNRVDAVVQIRPGSGTGVKAKLTYVGGVDRDDIDPFHYLYNYNAVAPNISNNRPWGGRVDFDGIIDRNGFNGNIKYKIMFKSFGAPDADYATVSTKESFQMLDFSTLTEFTDVQVAPDGWFLYKQNPALGLYDENNHLASWNTPGLDGAYTIKFVFTDEFGFEEVGDEFSMIINNSPMTVSPTANTSVDISKNIDDVIDGGDCHSYDDSNPTINGHIRAVHPYFGAWGLVLEPASHSHGTAPVPAGRSYSALGDTGDGNAPWSLNTAPLDPCGYTVSLLANTRVILDSSTLFPQYGPKAVGFAVLS